MTSGIGSWAKLRNEHWSLDLHSSPELDSVEVARVGSVNEEEAADVILRVIRLVELIADNRPDLTNAERASKAAVVHNWIAWLLT